MQEFIIEIINQYGYFAVLLLIALENIFPPIPSEVILCFAGFATVNTELTLGYMVIASTIGSVLGAIVLYYIGRVVDKDRLEQIVLGKVGKILHLNINHIDKADLWFQKRGKDAVLIGRCIPIIRSLISIPAGMSRMPLKYFLWYTVLGTIVWNTVLVSLGRISGKNWQFICGIVDSYSKVIIVGLLIVVSRVIVKQIKVRK